MGIEVGMVVKSVAGHDKGSFYVVIGVNNSRAFIVDGRVRLLQKPKAKNFIHLKKTNCIVNVEEFKTNKKIRELLHSYNYN